MELNGTAVTREGVRTWLVDKKITLWSDWCVTNPKRMELAIDWFLGEMADLSAKVSEVAMNGERKT